MEQQQEAPQGTGDVARDVLLKEMSELPSDETPEEGPAEEPAAEEPAAEEEPAEEESEESDSEEDDEESEDDEEESDDDDDDDDEEEPDDESSEEEEDDAGIDKKRLEALHAKERRLQEKIDRQKADVEKREQDVVAREQEIRQAVDVINLAGQRAKYDPVGLLEDLGAFADPEDYEVFARDAFARSPKGKEQGGGNRMQHREAMYRRQQATELEQLKVQNQQLQQQFEEQQNESMVREYLDDISGAVTEDHPLAQSYLNEDPGEARDELVSLAYRMHDQTGEIPDPDDVVEEFERLQARALRKRGVDPSTVRERRGTKKKTQKAGEEKAVKRKTLGNDLGTPTKPEPELEEADLKQDILANMPFPDGT